MASSMMRQDDFNIYKFISKSSNLNNINCDLLNLVILDKNPLTFGFRHSWVKGLKSAVMGTNKQTKKS